MFMIYITSEMCISVYQPHCLICSVAQVYLACLLFFLLQKLEVYFQLQHNVFFPIPDVVSELYSLHEYINVSILTPLPDGQLPDYSSGL